MTALSLTQKGGAGNPAPPFWVLSAASLFDVFIIQDTLFSDWRIHD